jgi:hypothetical protein
MSSEQAPVIPARASRPRSGVPGILNRAGGPARTLKQASTDLLERATGTLGSQGLVVSRMVL